MAAPSSESIPRGKGAQCIFPCLFLINAEIKPFRYFSLTKHPQWRASYLLCREMARPPVTISLFVYRHPRVTKETKQNAHVLCLEEFDPKCLCGAPNPREMAGPRSKSQVCLLEPHTSVGLPGINSQKTRKD